MSRLLKEIEIEGQIFKILDICDEMFENKKQMLSLTTDQKIGEFTNILPNFNRFKDLMKRIGKDEIEIIESKAFDIHIGFLDKECAFIIDFVLSPRFHGAGIGRILYTYTENIIRDLDFKCITLSSLTNIDITNFWKKMGFVPTDRLDIEFILPILEQINDRDITISEDDSVHFIPMRKILS